MSELVSHRSGLEASPLQGIERHFPGRRVTRLLTIYDAIQAPLSLIVAVYWGILSEF